MTAVVLHSSWRGRFFSLVPPALLFGGGIWGYSQGGRLVAVILIVLGGVMLGIGLFDYPWRTIIGPDGIERRCLLRTERLGWRRVTAVARPRSTKTVQRVAGKAGLVAEVGKRRYLLSNRCESGFEYEAIQRVIDRSGGRVLLRASEPPDEVAPTWMYQRRLDGGDGFVDAPADLPRWGSRR
ncbi:MAG: hypothetical protein AAFZ07_02655 [Actinomycetota bacterium]